MTSIKNYITGCSFFLLCLRLCLFIEAVVLYIDRNSIFSKEHGFFNHELVKIYLADSPIERIGLSPTLIIVFFMFLTFVSFIPSLLGIAFLTIGVLQLLLIKHLFFFADASFHILFYLCVIVGLVFFNFQIFRKIKIENFAKDVYPTLLLLHLFVYSFNFYWKLKSGWLDFNLSKKISLHSEIFRGPFSHDFFNLLFARTPTLGPLTLLILGLLICAPFIKNQKIRRLIVALGMLYHLGAFLFFKLGFLSFAYILALLPVYQQHFSLKVWPPIFWRSRLAFVFILTGLFFSQSPDNYFSPGQKSIFPGHNWQMFAPYPKEHIQWFIEYKNVAMETFRIPYHLGLSGLSFFDETFEYKAHYNLRRSEMTLLAQSLLQRFCEKNLANEEIKEIKLYRDTIFINREIQKKITAAQYSCCPLTMAQAQTCELM